MNDPLIILLADDDSDDQELFCEALYEFDKDILCHTVKNGEEAMKYLKNRANPLPDYIFLDYMMPKMSGKKCLMEIRADEELKDLPVIIYTTSDDVDDSKELSRSGADHFITKPSNPEEIYYLISMVITENWI